MLASWINYLTEPMRYQLSIKFKPESGEQQGVLVEAELDVAPLDHSPEFIAGQFINVSEDQVIQFELDLPDLEATYRSKKYKFECLDRVGTFRLRQGW